MEFAVLPVPSESGTAAHTPIGPTTYSRPMTDSDLGAGAGFVA
jgi:hypothetical protein